MKNILVLLITCAFFALVLGFVNYFTEPRIKANKLAKEQKAFKTLISEGEVGSPYKIDENEYGVNALYPVTDSGEFKSYLINMTGTGYSGDMIILSEITSDGEILGALLTENSETPGLGKAAENPAYMTKFIGTGTLENPVPANKADLSDSDADAISGATVTFSGISNALQKATEYIINREANNAE